MIEANPPPTSLGRRIALTDPSRGADKAHMIRIPPTLQRLFAGIALCGAFLLMASVFVPDPSSADPVLDPNALMHQSDPHAGLMSLGELTDDQYRVLIFAGPEGPVYTVSDAATGRTLGTLLTAEQVGDRFPDLPLPDMDFDTDTEFSLVDGAFHLPGQ